MRWEYRIESLPQTTNEAQARLNELGSEGWELVAITEHVAPPASPAVLGGYRRRAYLKRPAGESQDGRA